MPMDAQAIREMFGQTVLWVCGVGLCGLAAAMVGSCLCRIPACVLAKARRYGWLTVTVIGACMAFAAIEGAVTRAYKERYAGALVRDGASTNRHESARMEQVKETHAEARRGWGSGTDSCDGEGAVATNPSAEESRTLTDDDFARGFALTRIGTNETFGFSPPEGAEVCADWRAFGAAEDWMYLAFADWAFRLGTDEVDSIRVHSGGWVEASPAIVSGAQSTDGHDGAGADLGADNRIPLAFLPLKATLGIVPEANWPLVAVSGDSSTGAAPEAHAPSRFWHSITPSNTLVLTWQNAFLGRDASKPVSFQAEFWGDGRFAYRYGIPSLGTEAAAVSNVLVGAALAGLAWAMDGLPANVTSLSFHPLVAEDTVNPDTDGDGLLTADEIFVYGTDPHRADSDSDEFADPEELAAGTNPWNPDTDGDGLLDGEEAALGTNPLAVDTDVDGLSDFAEVCVHGTNPLLADTDGDGLPDADEIAGTTDPTRADSDGDGLDDAAELRLGTVPNDPDTDGDGAPDGWEVETGSDPFVADTDGDGLADGLEMTLGSSPLLSDTDGDGLDDFDEFKNLGTSPARADTDGDGLDDPTEFRRIGTNPCVADTDGDGLSDGDELSLGTDPLNPDTDGDGLEDGEEVSSGASPFKADTDGDGMPDVWEVRHGLDPASRSDATSDADGDGLSNSLEFMLGTSPLLVDTDGDGRSDSAEYDYGTSPVLSDTDGDGLDDGDEYRRGTSGTDPDTDHDGLPDGWEVRFGLDPRSGVGINGASGDPDGDGLPNAEEYALDTDPSDADSDGDGIPDGDEAGWPQAVRTVAGGWASVEGGWTEVALEPIEGMPAHLFEFGRPLTVGDEAALDAMCQWNGLILVETDRHGVGDVVDAPPQDMSGPYVSDAALAIAPFWTGNAADCPEPSIGVFMRGEGGNVAYAIQYGGDGVVPTQTTLTFTNGAYMAAEIVHGHFDVGAAQGFLASVGVQDAVGGRRWSADHGMCVPMAPSDAMRFVSGMGTDPAVAEGAVDTDGDGLPDALERQIDTDPSEPDTDGDGMHDGWEHSHGFNPKAHNGRDGDPLNDADADPDGDGLANREEADWGTDPHNDDTDGDGVPDGVEVEQSSDPADASDGGRPASRVPVAFTFGDPSGSHSEKYRLVVKPSKNPGGRKPASGEEPKAFDWVNAEYGECETKTAMLLRGWTYEVRMSHAGTDPDYDGSPRPDYDYWLSFSPPSCVGVVTNDPQRLFGENGNMGETFEAEGKVAEILVLDGCIVGDYDRIDGFSGYDLSRVYRNRPLRHWINDDDDEGNTNEGDGDIPGLLDPLGMDRSKLAIGVGREPDYFNNHVDGRCDVLDFMPVWIDVGRALKQLERTGDEIELTLSNDDGAVNVVWTSLSADGARRFLTEDIGGCGESLTQRLKDAKTIHVTEDEIRLPKKFVEAMRDDSAKGVILVEGRAVERSIPSASPLKLRCYRKPCTPGDGSHIFEMSLPLSISPVEDMFRWVDERWVCGDTNGVPSRMGLPWNNPDSECDGRHFVFVHGYSVSAQSARGWASEMFKRLWQSGSRAMFTAVDWYGDDSLGVVSFPPGHSDEAPNYYVNVEHAFATASRFVRDCAALEGQKVLLAHSLGNMLVSSAIKDHGLADYAKYYMLNAAVPMEAYDGGAYAAPMIDHDWRAVSNRVYSADWHQIFRVDDGRSRLTWRDRFRGIANAVNCYSTSEDTLGDAEMDEWLLGKRSRKKYWAMQEILKGTEYLPLAPDSYGLKCEGGWGYNPHYATNRFYVTWPNRRMTARFRKRIASLTDYDLMVHPVFRPFFEDGLFTTNAVSSEQVAPIRARILADGIPATSFAAGANPLDATVIGNINYATCKSGGWPRKDGSWRHSDIKNIAFRFNWKFFKKLVEEDSK